MYVKIKNVFFKAPMVSKRCEARIKVLFDSDFSFVGVPQRYICGLAEMIEDGLDRGPR